MDCRPIVLIIGTRPEGIKMMPVYFALKKAQLPVVLVSTMQHEQLLQDVFDIFSVKPDYDLGIMRQGQDLFYITQALLQKTKELLQQIKPSLVLVQGDTSSTFAASLSAFYLHIPIMHIEAGLRTGDMYAPFPEEFNRRCVSLLAQHHFAPTPAAAAHLLHEGVPEHAISVVGNTVVDALHLIQNMIADSSIRPSERLFERIAQAITARKRIVLLTIHRRESFDGGVERVLDAVAAFLRAHDDVVCFYPYHPNPHVVRALEHAQMQHLQNCHLMEPLVYADLVYLLSKADLVLTDSGGIQEEAISLGKHVLILREKTERKEGILAGMATLVGTDYATIIGSLEQLYATTVQSGRTTIYGDGKTAEKIVQHILDTQLLSLQPCANIVQDDQQMPLYAAATVVPQKRKKMRVVMLGLGYIGLPTALVMADNAIDVIGVDIDAARVAAINGGDPVIQEPEIFERLQVALQTQHFTATTQIDTADYYIIAVPTPFKEAKKADLRHVYAAVDMIATVVKNGDTILIESTVPVGTTQAIAAYLERTTGFKAGCDISIAHCPERVLPGNIFHELVHNDRIIGGITPLCAEKARLLYACFVKGSLNLTDTKSAEFIKLIENSSRDVQIAFAHQVASMAYALGLDPYQIIDLANKHPRVTILQPSAGVGGHCIAVDPWFLIETCERQTALLQAARQINDARPLEIIQFIQQAADTLMCATECKPKVLLMGLTYKPDVDDLRESPALHIAQLLINAPSLDLLVCEPHVKQVCLRGEFGDRVVTIADGIEQADIIVFLVAHTRFKAIDRMVLATKKVMDFCGSMHQKHGADDLHWPKESAAYMPFKTSSLVQENL
jgi:UDP-N-acetylglucosamine 2-epimerase (non-hydrolysing)